MVLLLPRALLLSCALLLLLCALLAPPAAADDLQPAGRYQGWSAPATAFATKTFKKVDRNTVKAGACVVAEFEGTDSSGITGYVSFEDVPGTEASVVRAHLDFTDAKDLPKDCFGAENTFEKFGWHVHLLWNYPRSVTNAQGSEACGKSFTALHLDPTMAGGGAGNPLVSGDTDFLPTDPDPTRYDCTPETYKANRYYVVKNLKLPLAAGGFSDESFSRATCQVGDSSNKYGADIKTIKSRAVYRLEVQDPLMARAAFMDGMSIVLHCKDGARQACAKLELKKTRGGGCKPFRRYP